MMLWHMWSLLSIGSAALPLLAPSPVGECCESAGGIEADTQRRSDQARRRRLEQLVQPDVLGVVGSAGGAELASLPCNNPKCEAAVVACRLHAECDTVEVRSSSNISRQGSGEVRSSSNKSRKVSATLRVSYTQWGAAVPGLERQVELCRGLASKVRKLAARPGDVSPRRLRVLEWSLHHCDEYAAPRGRTLPKLGTELPPLDESRLAYCPSPLSSMAIVTYMNRPSRWYCRMLRTLSYHQLPLTVLGWQPTASPRANKVFYHADKVYNTLLYLESCKRFVESNKLLLFVDADELLQVDAAELERRVSKVLATSGAEVVFSAELRCTPTKYAKRSHAHAEETSHGMPTSTPRCLNSGNYVGRAQAVLDMLNQSCIPCQEGVQIADVQRRFAYAYSRTVESWIFDDQKVIMEQYLSRSSNVSRWTLDFKQVLFRPQYWLNKRSEVEVQPDGRLINPLTGIMPAILHFNGDSKGWAGMISPGSVAAALRTLYGPATDKVESELFDAYVRDKVTFLGPDFRRDLSVTASQVCGT